MEFTKISFRKPLFFMALAFSISVFAQTPPPVNTNGSASTPAANTAALNTPAQKAIAVIYPTTGNKVHGTVIFTQSDNGIKIIAELAGLTPGEHGFHIHEYGDCSAADASSAGSHFDPYKKSHGGPDQAIHHAGDFGNIVADPAGNARYETNNSTITIDGPNSILGHALIIHANADDLTSQPAGNAGGRIACGVIGIANPK